MSILIAFIVTIPLAFGVYIYYKNYQWLVQNERSYQERFHIFATMLHVFKPHDIEDDEEFTSDPTLRKLMKGDDGEQQNFKAVSTRTVVDLEEVVSISEWSTSKFSDEKVISDCTMLFLKNGDQILVFEPLDIVMGTLEVYLGKRYGQ